MGWCLGSERKTTLKAEVSPSTRELEWAAGFLDGEGSFGHSGGNKSSEQVRATSTDLEYLQRLLVLFGGSVKEGSEHPSHVKRVWQWRTSGSRARGVMMTLYPLLGARRQARIKEVLFWLK